jgi:formylglycine-generating enzyme required for sulfatase activity
MAQRKNLGDYTLIKQLGCGSMGTAYLAEHRLMKQPCLIKVLPQELSSDSNFIHRFENEILALSTLDHANIVKIHNASSSDGQCFLVTDCVVNADGEPCNLSQYIVRRKYKLSEEEVVRIARQVASALDYAHQKKMGVEPFAHGSLKLNNILVRPSKEGIQLLLSDFGLSRVIGPGAVLSRTFKAVADQLSTNIGFTWNKRGEEKYATGKLNTHALTALHESFLQNFAFLAPEQKHLSSSRTQPVKADIYAFGVLIYYLLKQEMPEGFFELPKKSGDQKWHWDILLAHCLHRDPSLRPDLLSPLIEELTTPSASPAAKEQLQKLKEIAEQEQGTAPAGVSASQEQLVEQEEASLKPLLKPQEIVRPSFDADPGEIFQKELTVARYQPKVEEEKCVEPLMTEMVVISKGTYYRGSNHGARDEMPRHAVNMEAFAIDIHPVTNEQFVRFLEAMGGEKDANNNDIIRLRDSRIKRSGGKINIESGYARHPVVGVTWYGATAYARWIGKRLPTEAEWEIASYGGREDQVFATGQEIERTQANYFSSDTTAVSSYPPNGYGLYDMAGNVYEWCQDWYDYHYYDHSVQEPDHPKGPLQGVYRVLRGGCWKSLKEDLRCAHRHRNNPGVMNGTYGFRCAADVAE